MDMTRIQALSEDDPYICCLLLLCCPPLKQFEKLVALRMEKKDGVWFAAGLNRAAAEAEVRRDLELVARIKTGLRGVFA